MTLRIAINGFGRIGRNVLRALYTQGYRQDLQIVAINDLGDSSINAHLLKYDTVHGTFDAEVAHDNESLTVNGDRIAVSAIRNPADLPWAAERLMWCSNVPVCSPTVPRLPRISAPARAK